MSNSISVFISSKQGELDTERHIVRQRAEDAGLSAELAEEWPPGRADIRRVYLDRVASCCIYVGLFYRTYSEPTIEEYETASENPYREMLIYWRAAAAEEVDPRLMEFMKRVGFRHVYRKYQRPEDLLPMIREHLRAALTRMMQLLIGMGASPKGGNLFGHVPSDRMVHPAQQLLTGLGFPRGEYDNRRAAEVVEEMKAALDLM